MRLVYQFKTTSPNVVVKRGAEDPETMTFDQEDVTFWANEGQVTTVFVDGVADRFVPSKEDIVSDGFLSGAKYIPDEPIEEVPVTEELTNVSNDEEPSDENQGGQPEANNASLEGVSGQSDPPVDPVEGSQGVDGQ